MHSRVLRSSIKTQKRTFSSVPIAESTTVITTKKVKRIKRQSPDEVDNFNIEPIRYYDSLPLLETPPIIPDTFKNSHDPQFVEGLEFLIAKDPTFLQYITYAPFPSFVIDKTEQIRDDHYYFESLISGIISQQISGKAAKAIKQRLIDNLSDSTTRLPSAKIFTNSSTESLRSCGLSERKLTYVKLLAQAFDSGDLTKDKLETLTDEEIYDILIEYKGIGPWSVVMFLLFSLKRLNVFTHTDLGIMRGASRYLNERKDLLKQVERNTTLSLKKRKKKKKEFKNRKWIAVDEELVSTLSQEFEPYKSCLMLLLWRMSDIDIGALET